MPNNYEGTAIDSDVIEQLEAEPDDNIEETIEEPDVDVDVDDNNESVESIPLSYNIDGIGEVSAEQIREWRDSGLRQSDYTRKTQELARQRSELQDAVNIYEYLKQHPYITESIKKAENNPQFDMSAPSAERNALRDLQYQVQSMKVDNTINQLHEKYGDFNEESLFKKANETKTTDLELVLKSMMYDKKPATSAVEEAKRQLKEELEKDQSVVSTVITNKSGKTKKTPKLSSEEKHVAELMGMSPSEYAKWK